LKIRSLLDKVITNRDIMAFLRFQGHPSRKAAALFLGVAAVSVAALVWTGQRLIRQDRALEVKRLEERREAAADRLIAALEQALAEDEQRLAAFPAGDVPAAGDHVALISAGPQGFRVWPAKALLFLPVMTPGDEAPSRLFADVEKREFVDRDFQGAIRALRRFSGSKEPAVRTGARFLTARNLRKSGDLEGALAIYSGLAEAKDEGVKISGVPSELAARRARCDLLEELNRTDELRGEAQRILDGLAGRRWRLDKASYDHYLGQAAGWLGVAPASDPEELAMADAALWIWQNRQVIANVERGFAGRRLFRSRGISIAVLWRVANDRLGALIAGPAYQRNRWFEAIIKNPDFSNVEVAVLDSESGPVYGSRPPDGRPSTSRLASVTGLPWDIIVANSDDLAESGQFVQRRRLMAMVLGILVVLVAISTYFIGRAVSRELAAARLQSDFVSAVSHEFRTPLTSMRQFTEMLVEDENLPAGKRRAFYEAQERATRRLSRLVESLLDFGRMEAGARPYRLEPLDAGRLVEDIVRQFRQEIGSEDIEIHCEVPERGPVVKADREAITQALWNLLDNAVKYSGDRPVVRVEVEKGPEVAVRVRDNGPGIPASEKTRIFRKFVRGSNAKTQGIKGTGIGLAMVKHIVDAHGGHILVSSEPGQGSTFTILLPKGD
jgi:signal transduction histidine kinase